MGLYNNYSDYGSGSSSSSWMSQQDIRWSPLQPKPAMERPTYKSSSYSDLVTGRCTLDDVMREFQMNGSDSPYNPEEEVQERRPQYGLSGLGPASGYLRQRSWPAPERSPAPAPPPARSPAPPPPRAALTPLATSTPVFDEPPMFAGQPPPPAPSALTAEQCGLSSAQARVLAALPPAALHALVRQLQRTRTFQECRFCKNNGERESFYRAHVLKDGAGRVACPVLRAFRCARCGASGDRAHTIKYCPLSTNEERIKSAAMMRSVRMASGRRRGAGLPPGAAADYGLFGEPAPARADLDPLWAALEQKLLL